MTTAIFYPSSFTQCPLLFLIGKRCRVKDNLTMKLVGHDTADVQKYGQENEVDAVKAKESGQGNEDPRMKTGR